MKKLYLLIIAVFLIIIGNAQKSEFTIGKLEKSFSKINEKFYMSKYEVSNIQYRTFLASLKQNNENEKYNIANIDTSNCSIEERYNDVYAEIYLRHPIYADYPVVFISYEGAKLYCDWLTNEYNSFEKRKFKKVKFRLPSKDEWENAARGGLKENAYPWGGYFLRDYKGCKECNYLEIGEANIKYNEEKGEYEVINTGQAAVAHLMLINSFKGNGYDIYNMSGNVSEMISEKGIARGGSFLHTGYDVRILSEEKFEKPNRYTGFRICMEIIEF